MKIIATLLFSLFLFGCLKAAGKVPSGTYREPSNLESVEAHPNGLTFSIRVPKLDPQKVLTRGPYEYKVNSSGEIHIYASSNDSVFVFGILQYAWIWDGESIIRKEPTSGNRVTFVLQIDAKK